MSEELLISVPECARRLGLGETLTWRLVATGELPSLKIGLKSRRVRVTALEEFVAQKAEAAVV